jgi:hypothetical protein
LEGRCRVSDADAAHASTRIETHLAATIIIGAIVLASFFASPIVLGRVPVHGDMGWHFLPVRGLYAQCLQRGDSFDWMPQLFCGYFLTGEGQHGPYHPAHWLMYRWLPLDVAFSFEVFFPVILLGTGMVVFLRRYINLPGACMGGLLAAFSVTFVVHMQQPCITTIIAHLPWMLAAIHAVLNAATSRKRHLAFAAIALLTGSQILLGHPQATWFSMLTASLFGLYLLTTQRKGWKSWLIVGGAVSLGICLGAVQLLATYELLQTTHRATADVSKLSRGSVHPTDFLFAFSPWKEWSAFFPAYFGAVPSVLLFWWCIAWRHHPDSNQRSGPCCEIGNQRRAILHLSMWAFLAALFTAILSMGVEGKLYYLQTMLPFVGRFRTPARILMIPHFCVAILAAIAFARLVSHARTGQKTPWTHLALPWLPFIISALFALGAFLFRDFNPQGGFRSLLFLGPLYFMGAAIALTLAARGRQIGLGILVVLAVVDLGVHSVANPTKGNYHWSNLPTYNDYLASHPLPPDTDSGRIVHEGNPGDFLRRVNPYLLMGHRATNGNAGLYVRQALDYRHLNSLRVAETAWYWQPGNDDLRVAGLVSPPGGGWCTVPDPLPRVRMVSRVQFSDEPREDLKNIDIDKTALVARSLQLPASIPGTAEIRDDRPGEISVQVDTPGEQLLVVSESYHRSWQVSLDGKPAQLERVNGDFIGCVVSQGKHRVDFAFRCDSLRLGKFLSLASLALVMVTAVFPWRGRMVGQPPTIST